MIIFNGYQFAQQKEQQLTERLASLRTSGLVQPRVAAILFTEDAGSQLYTRLKQEAAQRVGIGYEIDRFSMNDEPAKVLAKIAQHNADPMMTGIIIQKPSRAVWMQTTGRPADEFTSWWHSLVSALELRKDVDGLHLQTLAHIQAGDWQRAGCVLPATAKAVLAILEEATADIGRTIILGKSDILGQPLFYELQHRGVDAEMIGSAELQERIEAGTALRDASVVISATGRPGLITGDLLQPHAIVIDVGEPKGDVDATSLQKLPPDQQPTFLTPMPGGVGPVTVVSLLENAVELLQPRNQ